MQVLERVTELRDCEVDKLKTQCDSTVPSVNANLLVAQSMCNKILEHSSSTEIVSISKLRNLNTKLNLQNEYFWHSKLFLACMRCFFGKTNVNF